MFVELTQARLKELYHYEPETGVWTRLIATSNRGPVGVVVLKPAPDGYLKLRIDGGLYRLSRLVVFYMTGVWPIEFMDHRRGDRLDNRWLELREATPFQNSCNRGLSSANTSGVTGVYWHDKAQKWGAQIKKFGRNMHLGLYVEFEQACRVRRDAEVKHFGEFRRA
jgi:hypothetical protein